MAYPYRFRLKNRVWQSTHSQGKSPKKNMIRSRRDLVRDTRRQEPPSHFGHSGFILVDARRPRRSGRGASAFLSDEVLEMGDEVIAVAITHRDKVAVCVVDALYGCGRGLEVEQPRVPYRHTCQIGPTLVAFWNHGFDLISGLEATDRFGPHEVASREALVGKPGALVSTAALGGDAQGGLFGAGDLNHGIHVAHADRIEGVCFGDEEAMAVPLGASAGAGRDRPTERLQCTIERPPGGIDGSAVLERLFCLRKDALEP